MGTANRKEGGETIPGKVGRPSKLTEETRKTLINALIAGCSIKESCTYADISESTYKGWSERAQADLEAGRDNEYTTFLSEVIRAREMSKPRLIGIISKAAEQDPRIALAILERRYPKEWGRREYVETKDKTGEPDEVDLSKMPDEELLKRAKQIIENRSQGT